MGQIEQTPVEQPEVQEERTETFTLKITKLTPTEKKEMTEAAVEEGYEIAEDGIPTMDAEKAEAHQQKLMEELYANMGEIKEDLNSDESHD